MKRNAEVAMHGNKSSRIGILSLLTLMVLLFSTGVSTAADEFSLFQFSDANQKWETLAHIGDDDAKAVKWLVTEPKPENYTEFAKSFSAEPFKFAEGLKAAILKANEGGEKGIEDFKKAVTEGLDKVERKDFGSKARKEALQDLIEKMLGMSKADLEKSDLLKTLFDKDLRQALGLKLKNPDEKPKPKEEATKTPPTEPTKTGTETPGKTTTGLDQKAIDDAMAKMRAEFAAQMAANKPLDVPPVKEVPTTPVTPVTPVTPIVPPPPAVRTGEIDDAALRKQAQDICDKFNALQKSQQDTLANAINPLKDALNETFNQLAGLSRQGNQQQQQKQNGLDQLLPGILADALKNDKQNQVTPPPPPPQQASRANRDNNNQNNQDIPLPPPQKDEPTPPQQPFQAPSLADNSPIQLREFRPPFSFGDSELSRARSVTARLKNRTSATETISQLNSTPFITPIVKQNMLMTTMSELDRNITDTQAAATSTRTKADALKREAEELKEATLDRDDKQKQLQTKQDYEEKKSGFDTEKQGIQQAIQAGSMDAQSGQAYLAQKAKEVTDAKKKMEGVELALSEKSQSKNAAVKKALAQADALSTEADNLDSELSKLKSEQGQVKNEYTNTVQQQLAAIQAANQPPAQNAAGGGATQNVNKILGFSGSGGGPRSTPPARLGAGTQLNSGSATSTPSGSTMRGSLGRTN